TPTSWTRALPAPAMCCAQPARTKRGCGSRCESPGFGFLPPTERPTQTDKTSRTRRSAIWTILRTFRSEVHGFPLGLLLVGDADESSRGTDEHRTLTVPDFTACLDHAAPVTDHLSYHLYRLLDWHRTTETHLHPHRHRQPAIGQHGP